MWKFVAYFLILWPDTIPVPSHVDESIFRGLQQASIELDLASKDEHWVDNFRTEVNYARSTWELCRGCPPSRTEHMFPISFEAAAVYCSAAERWDKHLTMIWETQSWQHDAVNVALADSTWRWEAWLALRSVKGSDSTSAKRQALGELRRLIGEERFWNGIMPAPVPLQFLEEQP